MYSVIGSAKPNGLDPELANELTSDVSDRMPSFFIRKTTIGGLSAKVKDPHRFAEALQIEADGEMGVQSPGREREE